jgi:hypothetical protein
MQLSSNMLRCKPSPNVDSSLSFTWLFLAQRSGSSRTVWVEIETFVLRRVPYLNVGS